MIFEGALKDTAINFASQLEATSPRVTENSADINGIPNQEGARVDIALMDVLFSSRSLFGKYSYCYWLRCYEYIVIIYLGWGLGRERFVRYRFSDKGHFLVIIKWHKTVRSVPLSLELAQVLGKARAIPHTLFAFH